MGFYDLGDRLNREQAMRVLGVGSKSAFYRLLMLAKGAIRAYGGIRHGSVIKGQRFFLKSELEAFLRKQAQARKGGSRG